MHKTKGLLNVAHNESGLRMERARASVNTTFGAHTDFVSPEDIHKLVPQLDMSGGGAWPILGGLVSP